MSSAWIAMICFFGDGSPLNDRCFDAQFVVDTIVECRTLGEEVPLNINTGVANPGNGVTILYETAFDGKRTVVAHTSFESRGYSSFRPNDATVYTIGSGSFYDGFEDCSCFTRLIGGCQ
jgi:hypothetical protein